MQQYYKGEDVTFTHDGAIALSSTYIPNLPNTGFEPQNGAAFAFALVTVLAVSVIAYPYARKAFFSITR
ncbi:hypothetical protein KW798_01865 [Candidatus Parcubacteria bacterium]|nr:hypothetical protein [Candidatus Parcubacteria bacterium]